MPIRFVHTIGVLEILLFWLLTGISFGQQPTVPRLIAFSGALQDGNRPANGVAGLTFALYKDQKGGAPVWLETQNVRIDDEGRYSVLLGSTQGEGLPAELFASGEARWLAVSTPTQDAGEQPRILLVSVPYALKAGDADTIGGKPASAFVLAETVADSKPATLVSLSNNKAGTIDGPGTFAVSGTGTPNLLTKWQDSIGTLIDSAVFESGGQVGVGTTSPIGKLNVANSGSPTYLTLSAYGADLFDKGILTRAARGTSAAPLPVVGGDILMNLYGQGLFGPNPVLDYAPAAGMTMAVEGTVGTGAVPGLILFQTADSSGTFAERMRINSAGNVGIGTTNPSARLDVNGFLKATSFVGDGSNLTNLPAGTANNVICTNCISTGEIVDGTIVNADIDAAAAIAPTKIAGTAATLGANTYTGTQMLTNGNLNLPVTTANGSSGVVTMNGKRFLHNYGNYNTFLGEDAGGAVTSGQFNTGIGYRAFYLTTTGSNNTAQGSSALYSNTSGSNNAASGFSAMYSNTTGSSNTATGAYALYSNTTADNNTAFGVNALYSNTTGTANAATGTNALFSNTTGSNNDASGYQALYLNTTGSNNTAVGVRSGVTATSANANTTGSNNTFIGFEAGPGTSTPLTNAAAIGANALVSTSNSMVLGDSNVSVGIGTQTPSAKLEVNGGVRLNSSIGKPNCNASTRGTFWITQQATGQEDSVEVCVKNSSDIYIWKTVF
jgi:hypothetical protein